jgi:dihydrofolate reductase
MTQLVRVQNFFLSSDGYGAGVDQSLEAPFGLAEPIGGSAPNLPFDLAAWALATASWPNRTEPGGTRGLDDYFVRDFSRNIGAEIMGRNKFGPQRGPWKDLDWKGWWGDDPPFHAPVFVLTHHHRPGFSLSDTTFHFVEAAPGEALRRVQGGRRGKGRADRRWCRHRPAVPRGGPRRHPPCGGGTDRDWSRGAAVDLPRGAARPLPPRDRSQPQRRHPLALLAAVTTPDANPDVAVGPDPAWHPEATVRGE